MPFTNISDAKKHHEMSQIVPKMYLLLGADIENT